MSDYCFVSSWPVDLKKEYRLDDFQGFSDTFKLTEGTSISSEWPENERIDVSSDGFGKFNPKQDWVRCYNMVPIVTDRFKTLYEKDLKGEVEFLPVVVQGHDVEMYVFNVLNAIDFIDYEKTSARENSIDPNVIRKIMGPISVKTSPDLNVFRDSRFQKAIFMKASFADEISKSEILGFVSKPLVEFSSPEVF